jgi:hypothetical protein
MDGDQSSSSRSAGVGCSTSRSRQRRQCSVTFLEQTGRRALERCAVRPGALRLGNAGRNSAGIPGRRTRNADRVCGKGNEATSPTRSGDIEGKVDMRGGFELSSKRFESRTVARVKCDAKGACSYQAPVLVLLSPSLVPKSRVRLDEVRLRGESGRNVSWCWSGSLSVDATVGCWHSTCGGCIEALR